MLLVTDGNATKHNFSDCLTPGLSHVRNPELLLVCAVVRREPSPLQLRAAVAAKAQQRGRPGDVRLTPASLRTILLVHPGGGVPVRAPPHHQILPRDEGARRAESCTQVSIINNNYCPAPEVEPPYDTRRSIFCIMFTSH